MDEVETIPLRGRDRENIQNLIRKSASPALASTNLARLIESGGSVTWKRFPAEYLEALIRLLGGSAYLSDYLVQQGKGWAEVFLKQIGIAEKTASRHLAELAPLLKQPISSEDFVRALRRHKRREYLRIGARDLLPGASVEETMREITALADAAPRTASSSFPQQNFATA